MPKLVRMTEAKEENRFGQQRVRLVRTEEVQSGYQTAPAAAPPVSLATERADEADKMLVPSASRQAAQAATTSSTKSQERRYRPVEIDVPKQVVTQEEWAAQQWNALTQKINDTQTKLDAANARYASVALWHGGGSHSAAHRNQGSGTADQRSGKGARRSESA